MDGQTVYISLVEEDEAQVTFSNLISPDCHSETPNERNVHYLSDVMCDIISLS